jgi:hypothetical protein
LPATFEGYLVEALARGVYKVAPRPLVVNSNGLEGIQEAIDLMRELGKKGSGANTDVIPRGEVKGTKDKNSPFKVVVQRP